MKHRRFSLLFSLLVVGLGLALPAAADTVPYSTYTYSYAGDYQASPHAFVPVTSYSSFEGTGALKSPEDIVTDSRGRVLVADSGNNRVLVLDEEYQFLTELTGYPSGDGETLAMNDPSGLFLDSRDHLYVADTGNGNLVEFDADYGFVRIIPAPRAELLPDGFDYRPTALAVDGMNRFYVISSGTNMGVITFDTEGVFEGFIGAQKVQTDTLSKFWRSIMSEEQLSRIEKNVPVSFNNIAIDQKGFIYVTTSSIDAYRLQQSISSRSSSSDYAPVKKLNPSGVDVLKRTGFFPPVGDLNFDPYIGQGKKNASALTEVAVRDNDIYSVVDSKYNKIFTYDEYGNLLYVFGGTGTVDGVFTSLVSIAYQGERLLALDSSRNSITVFEKTEYGQLIDKAINLQRDRKFSETIPIWREIEKYNNNYDLAYIGIGKSLLEEGEYREAMSYFEAVSNKEYYSKALKKYRAGFLKSFAILIPVLAVAIIWLVTRFFRFAKRYNLEHRSAGGKRPLRDELMYAFHILFHPFDGFWDLKHEKRGGMRGATILLALAVLAMIIKDFMSGYLYADLDKTASLSIAGTLTNILVPFFLWCIANWCLTTLMDGKGTFRDIYVATAYSLTPVTLLVIPATLLSNVLIMEELAFVSYAIGAGMFWAGLLIVFGCMTTHDYSLSKNIVVCLLSILGIAIILFLAFLFFNVTSRLITFVQNIITELSFRI